MGKWVDTEVRKRPNIEAGLATVLAPHLVTATDVSGFGGEVISFADGGEFKIMVLDLAKVEHVSSPFFGILMRLSKHLAERGAGLRLCRLRKSVTLALQACMMDKLLEIYEDVESAISS